MAITAKDVMALRQKTGLGMMECKEALKETDGDVSKAVDLLRERGLAKMDTRTDRSAAEGRVAATVSDDKTKAAVVEVNTETDFTANNESFKAMADKLASDALSQSAGDVELSDEMKSALDNVRITTKENAQFARGKVVGGQPNSRCGSYVHFTGKVGVVVELQTEGEEVSDQLLGDLCMHIAAVSPSPMGVDKDDIPAEIVEKEREIAKRQVIEQGKPENIAEKIVEGKIRKFFEDVTLLGQGFIKDDKTQIKDLLPKGVTIKAFARYQIGG